MGAECRTERPSHSTFDAPAAIKLMVRTRPLEHDGQQQLHSPDEGNDSAVNHRFFEMNLPNVEWRGTNANDSDYQGDWNSQQ